MLPSARGCKLHYSPPMMQEKFFHRRQASCTLCLVALAESPIAFVAVQSCAVEDNVELLIPQRAARWRVVERREPISRRACQPPVLINVESHGVVPQLERCVFDLAQEILGAKNVAVVVHEER